MEYANYCMLLGLESLESQDLVFFQGYWDGAHVCNKFTLIIWVVFFRE